MLVFEPFLELPDIGSFFFLDFLGEEKLLSFPFDGEGDISTAPLTGDLEYLPRPRDPENLLGPSSYEGDREVERLPRLLTGEITLLPFGDGDLGLSFRPSFFIFLLL